jgi:hypothetical protein
MIQKCGFTQTPYDHFVIWAFSLVRFRKQAFIAHKEKRPRDAEAFVA